MVVVLHIFTFLSFALVQGIDGSVLVLKDSDFKQTIAQHAIALVEFYAPWCGHCKRLAPEFESAAVKLSKNDPPVALAKVDCTVETIICGEVGVSGYPTLKVYKNGELAHDYDGPRTEDGIINYMVSRAGPASKELESISQLELLIAGDKPVIAAYFVSTDSPLAKTFLKLADDLMSSYKFCHATEKIIPKSEKEFVRIYLTKKMQTKLEEPFTEYTGKPVHAELKSWIEENAHGLCGLRQSDNQAQFTKPLVTFYHTFDYERDAKGSAYWRNRILKVLKHHRAGGSKLKCAVSSRDHFSYELTNYGIEPPMPEQPIVTALLDGGKKYKMVDTFSWGNVEKFLQDLDNGKLTPYMKSEPINTENPTSVKNVVAKNFDSIVNDPTKHVLIQFHADFCGHCKALKPIYEELAEKLRDEKHIVIAAMESTKNDVPSPFEVTGFPTIYFSKKDTKSSPQVYNGGRTLDDFVKYLATEVGLSGFDSDGQPKKTEL